MRGLQQLVRRQVAVDGVVAPAVQKAAYQEVPCGICTRRAGSSACLGVGWSRGSKKAALPADRQRHCPVHCCRPSHSKELLMLMQPGCIGLWTSGCTCPACTNCQTDWPMPRSPADRHAAAPSCQKSSWWAVKGKNLAFCSVGEQASEPVILHGAAVAHRPPQ